MDAAQKEGEENFMASVGVGCLQAPGTLACNSSHLERFKENYSDTVSRKMQE